MIMSHPFDTLDYAKKLALAGLPVPQAELQAQLLGDVLGKSIATPDDLAALNQHLSGKIDNLAQSVKSQIDNLEQRVDSKIDSLEQRIDRKIDSLEIKIDSLEQRIDIKLENLEQRIESKMDNMGLRSDNKLAAYARNVDTRLTCMNGDITLLKWMTGTTIGLLFTVLLKLFLH
jgi:cell division protein ZapA (FtsZ GTPase activity inhibitor)